MRVKSFGKTGLMVSEIGFGCSRIGGITAQNSAGSDAITVLQRALDEGITFYDTADMYSQGESESLVGKAFCDRRASVIIATKGGYCLPAQRQLMARIKPLVRPIINFLGIKRQNIPTGISGSLSQDFSEAHLINAIEGSLRRLKTDYIDIYQLHSPPQSVLETGTFIETLELMKKQGKIRFYGIAADCIEDAALSLKYPGVSSVQMPFGLLDKEALGSVFTAAAEKGVAVIARGCFGGSLLKDSLTEQELKDLTEKWPRILVYREIAKKHNRPILEMALKFSMRVPEITVNLLGMRTEEHVASNLKYANATPLSNEEYEELVDV